MSFIQIPSRYNKRPLGRVRINPHSWQAKGLLHCWPVSEGTGEFCRDHGPGQSHAKIDDIENDGDPMVTIASSGTIPPGGAIRHQESTGPANQGAFRLGKRVGSGVRSYLAAGHSPAPL